MGGLNLPSIRTYATNLRLSLRHALKNSQSTDMCHLWKSTVNENVNIDETLTQAGSLAKAKKTISLQVKSTALQHVTSLQLQGRCIASVIENVKAATIAIWTKTVSSLSASLFNFTRKALQQQLATNFKQGSMGKSDSNSLPPLQPRTNEQTRSK